MLRRLMLKQLDALRRAMIRWASFLTLMSHAIGAIGKFLRRVSQLRMLPMLSHRAPAMQARRRLRPLPLVEFRSHSKALLAAIGGLCLGLPGL